MLNKPELKSCLYMIAIFLATQVTAGSTLDKIRSEAQEEIAAARKEIIQAENAVKVAQDILEGARNERRKVIGSSKAQEVDERRQLRYSEKRAEDDATYAEEVLITEEERLQAKIDKAKALKAAVLEGLKAASLQLKTPAGLKALEAGIALAVEVEEVAKDKKIKQHTAYSKAARVEREMTEAEKLQKAVEAATEVLNAARAVLAKVEEEAKVKIEKAMAALKAAKAAAEGAGSSAGKPLVTSKKIEPIRKLTESTQKAAIVVENIVQTKIDKAKALKAAIEAALNPVKLALGATEGVEKAIKQAVLREIAIEIEEEAEKTNSTLTTLEQSLLNPILSSYLS